jgi:hypothetical protein
LIITLLLGVIWIEEIRLLGQRTGLDYVDFWDSLEEVGSDDAEVLGTGKLEEQCVHGNEAWCDVQNSERELMM